jgi:hypothetical protein
MQCEPDLFAVVGATHSASGFASRLNGRQQQTDQDSDNGNHHQQLDQSET